MNLGILLQRVPGPDAPFGRLTPFAERVSSLAQYEGVAVTAFAPEDVDPVTGHLVAGHYDGPERGWTFRESPLPEVLWDRTLRRGLAHLTPFISRGVRLINQGWLDKWESHQLLSRSEGLRPHLPRTERLTEVRTLEQILWEHPMVFIKPTAGSVGRGIIRVFPAGLGCLQLQYLSRESGSVREVFATLAQFERWLARQEGEHIVQQGLDLNVWNGHPADVRALVQKDGAGRWAVTGMGARVAAPGRFTTNLHTGGQGMPVEQLAEVLNAPASLQDEMERLALEAAQTLDQGSGPLGEIGLDFGIDTGGSIWFIEQNGQPGRSIFEQIGRWDLADLAHLRPVQYANHLAKKSLAAAT